MHYPFFKPERDSYYCIEFRRFDKTKKDDKGVYKCGAVYRAMDFPTLTAIVLKRFANEPNAYVDSELFGYLLKYGVDEEYQEIISEAEILVTTMSPKAIDVSKTEVEKFMKAPSNHWLAHEDRVAKLTPVIEGLKYDLGDYLVGFLSNKTVGTWTFDKDLEYYYGGYKIGQPAHIFSVLTTENWVLFFPATHEKTGPEGQEIERPLGPSGSWIWEILKADVFTVARHFYYYQRRDARSGQHVYDPQPIPIRNIKMAVEDTMNGLVG